MQHKYIAKVRTKTGKFRYVYKNKQTATPIKRGGLKFGQTKAKQIKRQGLKFGQTEAKPIPRAYIKFRRAGAKRI